MTLTAATSTGTHTDGIPWFRFARESVELVVLEPDVNGTAVANYEVQAVPNGTRPTPTAWAAPTVAGDDTGYLVDGLAPGWHDIWVRYAATPETPVQLAARVHVT